LKYILLSRIAVKLLAPLFDRWNNASRHGLERCLAAGPVGPSAGPRRHAGTGFSLMHGLSLLTLPEKEWIGLAAYRHFDWTNRLLPRGDI